MNQNKADIMERNKMSIIQKYLESLHISEISQYTISLGTGGWPAWQRILLDITTTAEGCMRLRTPVERKICKYRVKVTEARRKIAFLNTVDCRLAKQPESCEKQIDEQINKMQMSLRDNSDKIAQLVRTR